MFPASQRRIAVAIPLVLGLCTGLHAQQRDLGEKIAAYWQSQTCSEAVCENPVLVVSDSDVEVVRPDENFKGDHILLKDLAAYLRNMPVSAWPEGARLWLRPADAATVLPGEPPSDWVAAQQKQMTDALRICRQLGLEPTTDFAARD